MPTEFRLRFPITEVMFWAARYSYADDAEVEAIGRAARERGWYTRDEFLTVTRWKTQRSRSRCEDNDEASVESMTRLALSTPDERIRIEAFTRLHGVAYPTASVLLHFARPDLYPIIDFRALWSLGWDSPPMSYTFDFWWGYTLACRSLAKNAGVTVRTLDRAMWGSDQAASVEPGGFERLVKYIRVSEASLGDGIKKVYESELPSLKKLRRLVSGE